MSISTARHPAHPQGATRAASGAAVSKSVNGAGGATIPQSERLCKVLPKVMETAIKGVRDLDEQVRTYVVLQDKLRRPPFWASF